MTDRVRAAAVARQLEDEFSVLPAGARVPSDQALADRFLVGRGVIGGIMSRLARRGLVRRARGAGTRWLGGAVGARLPAGDAATVPSFSEAVRALGLTPGFRMISHGMHRAVGAERELLGLSPNSMVWRLQRVLTVDDERVGVATSALPYRGLPGLPGEFDAHGSVYQTLRRRYGLQTVRAWTRSRVVPAPEFVREALLLRAAEWPLLEESLNRTVDGMPVEFTRTFLRCDGIAAELRASDTLAEAPGPL